MPLEGVTATVTHGWELSTQPFSVPDTARKGWETEAPVLSTLPKMSDRTA